MRSRFLSSKPAVGTEVPPDGRLDWRLKGPALVSARYRLIHAAFSLRAGGTAWNQLFAPDLTPSAFTPHRIFPIESRQSVPAST